jgi:hypothetical protein
LPEILLKQKSIFTPHQANEVSAPANPDSGQFQDGYAVLTEQTYDGDGIEGQDETT